MAAAIAGAAELIQNAECRRFIMDLLHNYYGEDQSLQVFLDISDRIGVGIHPPVPATPYRPHPDEYAPGDIPGGNDTVATTTYVQPVGMNTINLWKPFFDSTPLRQSQTILHEQIHNFTGFSDVALAAVLDWDLAGRVVTPDVSAEASIFWDEKLRMHCK